MQNPRPKLIGLSLLAIAAASSLSAQITGNTYLVHNLVSDLPGIADHQDTNLVNPWGNGFECQTPLLDRKQWQRDIDAPLHPRRVQGQRPRIFVVSIPAAREAQPAGAP